jgi:DNA-binding PadR family transcriptional regulator
MDIDLKSEKPIIRMEEISNLSIKHLIVLIFLIRYKEPIIKNALRSRINAYFESKISPGSFYNIITKLEDAELIQTFDKNKIFPSEKGIDVIKVIRSFIINNTINYYDLIEEFLFNFTENLNRDNFQKSLLIILERDVDPQVVNLASNLSEESYICAPEDKYKRLIDLGLDKSIKQTSISPLGEIDANSGSFDTVIISTFYVGIAIVFKELIKEILRVCRPGGIVMLQGIKKPEEKHFIIDNLRENIFNDQFIYNITQHELQSILDINNILFNQIVEENGLLIGIGFKG